MGYKWDMNVDVERDANGMLMGQSLTPCTTGLTPETDGPWRMQGIGQHIVDHLRGVKYQGNDLYRENHRLID